MLVFTIVLSRLAKVSTGGAPYPVFRDHQIQRHRDFRKRAERQRA
jgi:hypothetical protein